MWLLRLRLIMTQNTAPSVKRIKAGFTFPDLTKIFGQPTFHMLQTIKQDLTENVSTLETPVTLISYVSLIFLQRIYLQYVPAPFPIPQNPVPCQHT